MIHDGLLLLIIINPFSQMVYLSKLMDESTKRDFLIIYFQATLMSLIICVLFAFVGELVLYDIFQVSLSAMRIFGGILILSVAYVFIMRGSEGIKLFQGHVSEIAQQIMLPLMIGPGVIWMCVKIGETYSGPISALIIALGLILNALLVFTYYIFYKDARGVVAVAMKKYFGIIMRLNAFMMGAVSVEMILSGIHDYF
jgi:multiple antibiotic resistance protein